VGETAAVIRQIFNPLQRRDCSTAAIGPARSNRRLPSHHRVLVMTLAV
jgi:hypothetical protein